MHSSQLAVAPLFQKQQIRPKRPLPHLLVRRLRAKSSESIDVSASARNNGVAAARGGSAHTCKHSTTSALGDAVKYECHLAGNLSCDRMVCVDGTLASMVPARVGIHEKTDPSLLYLIATEPREMRGK